MCSGSKSMNWTPKKKVGCGDAGRLASVSADQHGRAEPERGRTFQPALPKDLSFHLPAGLIGNPTAVPQCPRWLSRIPSNGRQRMSRGHGVGVAMVTIDEEDDFGLATLPVPLFNLEPCGVSRRGSASRCSVLPCCSTRRSARAGTMGWTSMSIRHRVGSVRRGSRDVLGGAGDLRHDLSRDWDCLYTYGTNAPHWVSPSRRRS